MSYIPFNTGEIHTEERDKHWRAWVNDGGSHPEMHGFGMSEDEAIGNLVRNFCGGWMHIGHRKSIAELHQSISEPA